jgi:hypothetical protein
MKIVDLGKDQVTIQFSKDELGFIGNAMNETFEALDDWEFPVRTGTSLVEARSIQEKIIKAFREMDPKK